MIALEKAIHKLLAMFALTVAMYGVLVAATEHMPDPPPPESCTCVGKADCSKTVFALYNDDRASCAIWANDQSCCVVGRR